MANYIDFVVRCRLHPDRKEPIRVYYVSHEGAPFPLPPNICDNSNGCDICQNCTADILTKALKENPPFFG